MGTDNYVYRVYARARTHTYEMGESVPICPLGGEKPAASAHAGASTPPGRRPAGGAVSATRGNIGRVGSNIFNGLWESVA